MTRKCGLASHLVRPDFILPVIDTVSEEHTRIFWHARSLFNFWAYKRFEADANVVPVDTDGLEVKRDTFSERSLSLSTAVVVCASPGYWIP